MLSPLGFFSFFFPISERGTENKHSNRKYWDTHTHRVKDFIVSPAVPTQKSYRLYGQIAKVANTYVLPA